MLPLSLPFYSTHPSSFLIGFIMLSALPIALLAVSTLVSAGNVVVNPNKPPARTEPGQIGYAPLPPFEDFFHLLLGAVDAIFCVTGVTLLVQHVEATRATNGCGVPSPDATRVACAHFATRHSLLWTFFVCVRSLYNDCYRRKDSPSAKCQTLYINSLTDFCLWAPHKKSTVGDAEATVVSYCTAAGHGSRLMPKGTIKGAHYIRTPHYIQITGVGDFTKINIPKGDEGGELDPHGADGTGNPKGGIVIANVDGRKVQIQEWTEFIAYNEFCIRACLPGKDAKRWCEHIYDVMGCFWNEPGNYKSGSFDTCAADDTILPMGEYYVKGKNGKKSVSTFHQGQAKTPGPHPAGKSSKCKAIKTISPASYPK
ncbi:BZ3500_MvSof-1268-A1-R1_Chr6-3g08976 [Microbotryum saponariae]|uniref:BZ3500_MvSof-1268-A1-R1_Chr6-3g08976 protein n=1 Tax=Microbotryum saponariae TaxID=289078 RepID=A0A2X0KK66_9BASI|nr:BZ3500_MvSof-1268-A1-R1_Chr6-3g08976 [Microbotryum saponariae]SDA07578.1 BZ3501_MvSof-1269-A2-R1_Chr6-2g08680 [Microbotryum saponariae]